MHREIVLCEVTAERRGEVATYIGECALLLAQVASGRRLSDDLKKRILCSFVSLMNLRENLDRTASSQTLQARNPMAEVVLARAIAPVGPPFVPDHGTMAQNPGGAMSPKRALLYRA
jgi:hypothetical protein